MTSPFGGGPTESGVLVSVALLDVDGALVFGQAEHQVHYAASVMKIAVLVAVHRCMDAGILSSRAVVDVTAPVLSPVTGDPVLVEADANDPTLLAMGCASVATLIDRMITISSNEATNHLINLVGAPACDQVWRDIGATGCEVGRLLYDGGAREAGATNTITALGAAKLMHAIYTHQVAHRSSCRAMRATLQAQRHRDLIPPLCPPGSVIGNKEGASTGVRHDVAYVRPPEGSPFTLAVSASGTATLTEMDTLLANEITAALAVRP